MTKEELIKIIEEELQEMLDEESLHKWFSGKSKGWVQVGGKYDGKPCAKQKGQKTKPKCTILLSQMYIQVKKE